MVQRLSKGVIPGVVLGLLPFVVKFTIVRDIGGFCTYTDFSALFFGMLALVCAFNGMRVSRKSDLGFNIPLGLIGIALGVYQFLLGGGIFGCPAGVSG